MVKIPKGYVTIQHRSVVDLRLKGIRTRDAPINGGFCHGLSEFNNLRVSHRRMIAYASVGSIGLLVDLQFCPCSRETTRRVA